MALKAAEIRAFPALDSAYRKTDAKGLYLEIRPNGAKRWFFKYRVLGSEKRLTLGDWPEVSLAEARDLRDQARREVKEGGDPLHDRKKKKIMARLSADNSFQSVAEDFIAVKFVGNQRAAATIEKARWYLSHLTKPIGGRPVAEIEPSELLAVLKKLERAGKRETAVRTRAFASRVFRHGVAMALWTLQRCLVTH